MEDLRPRITQNLWARMMLAAHVQGQSVTTYSRLLLARWATDQRAGGDQRQSRAPPTALKPVADEGQGKQRRLPVTEATASAIRHAAVDAGLIRAPSTMLIRILDAMVPSLEDSVSQLKTKAE